MAEAARTHQPSLRERVGALRNLPPFLREIWATSATLTVTSLGLRLVRALIPVATLFVGKLIIDEAVRLVGQGLPSASLAQAWHLPAWHTLPSLQSASFTHSGLASQAPARQTWPGPHASSPVHCWH